MWRALFAFPIPCSLWRPASASPTCDIMVRPNAPDRFNEEKATYVIRGSGEEGDKPDLERGAGVIRGVVRRSEEHTSELQSLMRISYAVFCLKKKNNNIKIMKKNDPVIR